MGIIMFIDVHHSMYNPLFY